VKATIAALLLGASALAGCGSTTDRGATEATSTTQVSTTATAERATTSTAVPATTTTWTTTTAAASKAGSLNRDSVAAIVAAVDKACALAARGDGKAATDVGFQALAEFSRLYSPTPSVQAYWTDMFIAQAEDTCPGRSRVFTG
jgi:hypothetical protein